LDVEEIGVVGWEKSGAETDARIAARGGLRLGHCGSAGDYGKPTTYWYLKTALGTTGLWDYPTEQSGKTLKVRAHPLYAERPAITVLRKEKIT
jgi:hypothetical protein